MRCTEIYKDLHASENIFNFRRELGYFVACSKIEDATSCELLANDYTEDVLVDFDDYSTFSATLDG